MTYHKSVPKSSVFLPNGGQGISKYCKMSDISKAYEYKDVSDKIEIEDNGIRIILTFTLNNHQTTRRKLK